LYQPIGLGKRFGKNAEKGEKPDCPFFVCTPWEITCPMGHWRAMKSGAHDICEVPLALTIEEMLEN